MYYFKGTYNGDEKEITNIYINNNTINRQGGLFGYIGHGGEVKNIIISGTIINNIVRPTGGIVGRNDGIIDNCVNNANVENNLMSVGGIAGSNFNTIKNCVNSGTVKGSSGEGAGGIVGNGGSIKEATIKEPIIESCTNTDKAIVEGNSYIGGICGYTYASKIKNCTNEGTVTASTSMVGGIVGESKTDISSCKNKGEITSNGCPANQATTQGTGGIAGRASSTISKCSNIGTISSNGFFTGGIVGFGEEGTNVEESYNYNAIIQAGKSGAGGIVGRGDGITIENCYNYLSSNEYYIHTQDENAGGIIGAFAGGTNNTIKNCYSIGNNIKSVSVSWNVPNYYAGAVIGVTYADETNIANVYYENTNPLQALSPDSYKTNGTIQSKPLQDFKSQITNTNSVTYILNENQENKVWGQNDKINGGYPYLEENKP